MRFSPPIPALRIFDEAKAREFYLDFLGFEVDFEHRFEDDLPLFMQISRGDCVLQLSEHHGGACPGAAVCIPVEGIDAFVEELRAKRYKFARPEIEEKPWGARETTIDDPFGNHLTFSETSVESPLGATPA